MKPQPEILAIWRVFLVISALVPAFLCSLLLRPGSPLWWAGTLLWLLLFLGVYLIYLPLRYKSISFKLDRYKITLHNGVFNNSISAIPLENIQFTTIVSNPIGRIFGLCSLTITSPGGRVTIPGLRPGDAKTLAGLLPESRCADE